MATAPRPDLPLLYKALVPLNAQQHARWRSRTTDKATWLAKQNVVPLTIEEFVLAQRHFPIIFSSGDKPVPLALMGLNDGVNVFVDDEGMPLQAAYIPAYVRRYPYLLARLDQNAEELSLCFDPDSGLLTENGDGPALFAGEKPSEALNTILKFCEDFEIAAQRTSAFVKELTDMDLLIDGEVTIQPEGSEQPFVYRGFRMVDENKLREMNGDQLRKINQNGILALIIAHLFSLSSIRDLFARQQQQGKVPEPVAGPAPAPAI